MNSPKSTGNTVKTWNPTKYQGLYKHANGTYYVRIGSKTWRSLKTKVQAVALNRRNEVLAEAERQIDNPASISLAGTKVADAVEMRRWQIYNDASLKRSTKVAMNKVLQSVLNSWAGLDQRDLRKVNRVECEQWAGAQSQKYSAGRFNAMLSALNRLFEVGIDGGLISKNPAASIRRAKPKKKDLLSTLPSREEFKEFVKAIRGCKSPSSEARGDFVEFLAFSGLRIAEANAVQWKHVDWVRGELIVEGEEENEGTKNRLSRRVPMIAELRTLLEKMRQSRVAKGQNEKVLEVNNAKATMKNAARKLGLTPMRHHDMRHLFATTCIESGVDVPTIAYWLGHQDGGALAMKTYGHLRNEHSRAAAERVSFG